MLVVNLYTEFITMDNNLLIIHYHGHLLTVKKTLILCLFKIVENLLDLRNMLAIVEEDSLVLLGI